MEDDPSCVHQFVKPSPVASHLQNFGMMSTVILKNHSAVRPREIHPCDELPSDTYLELKHRR